jgi:hypothetical protein
VSDRRHGPWFGFWLAIGLGLLLYGLAIGTVTCAVTDCWE